MFAQEVLKVVVGHCCNNIGWHSVQASSLDLLNEVLQKYITEIGKSVHRYSEQCKKSCCRVMFPDASYFIVIIFECF